MASTSIIEVEKHETISVDGANGEKGKLAMVSGSFYISKELSKLHGDDAHFISDEKQIIGVADGFGGWLGKGIDARIYARQLMSNALKSLQNQPLHNIDPSTVLNDAYSNTKAKGFSTAYASKQCIIALQNNSLRVVNVGDSGFMLIRQGADIYKSPIQQYSFNTPYQLANDKRNTPSSAQVYTIPVGEGGEVITGTDGLFDNLLECEIEEITRKGIDQGLDPRDIAWIIAGHAYYNSMNRNAFTPFSRASLKAGKNHHGGKPDDITVIVSYIILS